MGLTNEERSACIRLDRQFSAIRDLPRPLSEGERKALRISQLQSGGYIRIRGGTYRVMGRLQIRADGLRRNELELFCLESGEDRYLHWDKEDHVLLSLNSGSIPLESLGSSPLAFEEIIETGQGALCFGDREFGFARRYLAERVRVGVRKPKPQSVHCFEFVSGEARVMVERPDVDERALQSFEAHVLQTVPTGEVEILFAKG